MSNDGLFSFDSFLDDYQSKVSVQKPEAEDDLLAGDELDIISFVESAGGLNMVLRPVQRVILKLFYGVPLSREICPYDPSVPVVEDNRCLRIVHPITGNVMGPMSEYGYYQYLLENRKTNGVEGRKNYDTLALVIGRRGGKSNISVAMACYEIYKLLRKFCPQDHYKLKRGATIKVILVGVDKDQSANLFNDLKMFTTNSPLLSKFLVAELNETLEFGTPYDFELAKGNKKDVRATVHISPQASDGASLRGGSAIQGIMDEVAHMKSEKSKRGSALEIYKAISASVGTFYDGKMVIISSPNGANGFFYNFVNSAAQNDGGSTLFIQAPTWEVNPGRLSNEFLRNSYFLDKNTFYQEYEAKFEASVRAYIEDFSLFEECVYPVPSEERPKGKLESREMRVSGNQDFDYFASLDQAYKNDNTVLSIGYYDYESNKFVVVFVKKYVPGDAEWSLETNPRVLSSAKIVTDIVAICKQFNVSKGFFDQHQGTSLQEEFLKHKANNYYMINNTETLKSDVYIRFQSLYMERRIELPGLIWLVDEFKNLEQTMLHKGKIKVEAPYKLHDDGPDSITRLVYCLYTEKVLGVPVIGSGDVLTKSNLGEKNYEHKVLSIKNSKSIKKSSYDKIKSRYGGSYVDNYVRGFNARNRY